MLPAMHALCWPGLKFTTWRSNAINFVFDIGNDEMSVTAALVKELREKSGAGMMDCKKALGETGSDMDAAVDWLRTKGLAAAAKKSGRVAAEGLVGISVAGTKGAVVELNA